MLLGKCAEQVRKVSERRRRAARGGHYILSASSSAPPMMRRGSSPPGRAPALPRAGSVSDVSDVRDGAVWHGSWRGAALNAGRQ